MANKKRKESGKVHEVKNENRTDIARKMESYLNGWSGILIFVLFAAALLLYFYSPMVFDKKSPSGVDVIAGVGKTHQVYQWEKDHGEKALWNPYVFGGMPLYHRIGPQTFSLDNILVYLGKLFNLYFLLFIFGGLGVFLLLKYLKIRSYWAFLTGLIFLLWPHFHALIIVGHFMKFRALMYMPWVFWSFLYLLDSASLLSLPLFGIMLAVQMRTQHYQIVFYTLLLMFIVAVFYLITYFKEKQFKKIYKIFGYVTVSFILTLLAVAQPTLIMKEYAPYSTRGGKSIKLNEQQNKAESKGVGLDYAVRWSLAPAEMIDLFIPRFHGGSSLEIYDGNSVPGLAKGRQVGNVYWGQMPFTQSYEFFGIILLLLALIGITVEFNSHLLARALAVTWIIALLLSFGRHFLPFYKLFFMYVPFFDKFRVPMMAVTLLFFMTLLAAAMGMRVLEKALTEEKTRKSVLTMLGVGVVLFVVAVVAYNVSSFVSPAESVRKGDNTIRLYKMLRSEIALKGLINTLFFLITFSLIVYLAMQKKLSLFIAGIVVLVLQMADLFSLDARYFKVHGDFKNVEAVKRGAFRPGELERRLAQDATTYRVLPVGRIMESNNWSYYFQSLGGYSPAKLQTIQNIRENNLNFPVDGRIPINANVLDITNVKYLFIQQQIKHPDYQQLFQDKAKGIYVYEYLHAKPRMFPVKKVIVGMSDREILLKLNDPSFNADSLAFVDAAVDEGITYPDSFSYKIDVFSPNKISGEVYISQTAFVLISEMYYPKWKLQIDGQEQRLYQTDYLVRGAVIPAGKHKFVMYFDDGSFKKAVAVSKVGLWAMYILLSVALYRKFGKNFTVKK